MLSLKSNKGNENKIQRLTNRSLSHQALKKSYEKKLSNVERAKNSTLATLKSEQSAAMAAKDEEVKQREQQAQERVSTVEAMLK